MVARQLPVSDVVQYRYVNVKHERVNAQILIICHGCNAIGNQFRAKQRG